MKLAACLRAVAQIAQALPKNLKLGDSLNPMEYSQRRLLFLARKDIIELMQEITEEKVRLAMDEQMRRLPRQIIDRLVDEALQGKREALLPFIGEASASAMRDLIKRDLKHGGLRVTNAQGAAMRVRWRIPRRTKVLAEALSVASSWC